MRILALLSTTLVACSLLSAGCGWAPYPPQQVSQAPVQPVVYNIYPETKVVEVNRPPEPAPRVIYVNVPTPEPAPVYNTTYKTVVHRDRPRYRPPVFRPIIRIRPPRWFPHPRPKPPKHRPGPGRKKRGGKKKGGGGGGGGGYSERTDPPEPPATNAKVVGGPPRKAPPPKKTVRMLSSN